MSQIESPIPPLNRRERRFQNSEFRRNKPLFHSADASINRLHETGNERNQYVNRHSQTGDLARATYTHPLVLVQYYDALRSFSEQIQATRAKYGEDLPGLKKDLKTDYFSRKIRGISLADIEKMEMPLHEEDMQKILKFLRYRFFSRFSLGSFDILAQDLAVTLPVLKYILPSESSFPAKLRPLEKRLSCFFDYFSDYMAKDYQIDDFDDWKYARIIIGAGGRLIQGMGMYIPSKLGISPSSFIKLWDERTSLGVGFANNFALSGFNRVAKDCIPRNDLSDEFREALNFDIKSNHEITGTLLDYYKDHFQGLADEIRLPETLFKRMRFYEKALRGDLKKTKGGEVTLKLDNPLMRSVKIGSLYRHSLSFLLNLNSSRRLIVEVNNEEDRLFGIPRQAMEGIPHITDNIAQDLLSSVLEFCQRKYPHLEPRPRIVITPKPLESLAKKPSSLSVVDFEISEPARKPSKKKRALMSLIDSSPTSLPALPDERKKQFKVEYSRGQVAKKLGLTEDDGNVQRVMSGLDKFEWGAKEAKHIRAAPGHVRVRIGDLRAALESRGSGVYELVAIETRNDAYSKKGLARIT